jgi:hypothetical protein
MVFWKCMFTCTNGTCIDRITFVNWESALVNCKNDSLLVKELFQYLLGDLPRLKEELRQEYNKQFFQNVSEVAHMIRIDADILACGNLTYNVHRLQLDPENENYLNLTFKSIDKTIGVIKTRYRE